MAKQNGKTSASYAQASDFTLTDTQGRTVRLADYRGHRHVILVFARGFGCPYCRRHLTDLRQDYPEFAARGAEVLVVGPDHPAAFRNWWEELQLPFVGLADPQHIVANAYGQEVSLLRLGRLPALVVIDKAGQIRFEHKGEYMSDLPAHSEILDLLDALNREENP